MRSSGKHTERKIKRIKKTIITILALGILCAGCGRTTIVTEDVPEQAEPAQADRVIALSESNAELWLLAGGELVATSEDAMDLEGLNADAVSLGDMDNVSLEAITALSPDLLIVFSTDPSQKALGETAEGIGIPVYYTNIDGFADYDSVMKQLTDYSGHPEKYKEYVINVRTQIEDVIAQVPESAQGTYLLLHVSATKAKVEKNDYFASEIFNNLGLTNIAEDNSSFDELSTEAILAADPDYIFIVPRGNEEKALASFEKLFTSNPGWDTLTAVSEGNYYLLSKELFGLKPNADWGEAYGEAYELLYGE